MILKLNIYLWIFAHLVALVLLYAYKFVVSLPIIFSLAKEAFFSESYIHTKFK